MQSSTKYTSIIVELFLLKTKIYNLFKNNYLKEKQLYIVQENFPPHSLRFLLAFYKSIYCFAKII